MEPTLAVIGLNYRTSSVAVRERFWIGESGRYEALHHLLRSEGVDEAIVLATSNRTEFILWANDVPAAANRELDDRSGQDMLTVAVEKLFQLDKSDLIETGQEN